MAGTIVSNLQNLTAAYTVKKVNRLQKSETGFLLNEDNRIQSLDGWRALSILLVIIGHLGVGYTLNANTDNHLFSFFSKHNYALNGVNTFFVISGFLITSILLNEKKKTGSISLKNFYLRRTFRIFPVFYFYLVVIAVLAILLHWPLTPIIFFQCALYLSNYPMYQSATVLNHSWSLSLEEQYYLLWPFIVKKIRSSKVLLFSGLLICLMCSAFRIYYYGHQNPSTRILAGLFLNLDAILIGSMGAIFCRLRDVQSIFKNSVTTAILLGTAVLLYVFVEYANRAMIAGFITIPFTNTLESACILTWLIYTVTQKSIISTILNLKPLRVIGLWSYSIYIWQQLFLLPFATSQEVSNQTAKYYNIFPWSVTLILIVSIASYYGIEKPIQKLKFKLTRFL